MCDITETFSPLKKQKIVTAQIISEEKLTI